MISAGKDREALSSCHGEGGMDCPRWRVVCSLSCSSSLTRNISMCIDTAGISGADAPTPTVCRRLSPPQTARRSAAYVEGSERLQKIVCSSSSGTQRQSQSTSPICPPCILAVLNKSSPTMFMGSPPPKIHHHLLGL